MTPALVIDGQFAPGTLRSRFDGSQSLFDGRRYLRRIRSHVGLEACNDLPVGADQELSKIPLNLSARFRILGLVSQELIERSDSIALYGHLGHHREGHVIL